MRLSRTLFAIVLATACQAQPIQPDTARQRAAMTKLAFLVGSWSGEATVHTRGRPLKVAQTEEVVWKNDGLVLLIEGVGRHAESGAIVYSALGTISYDENANLYHLRTHREGRYLDVELAVVPNGYDWSYKAGNAVVTFRMRINEKGEWVENGEITPGINAPRPTFEMKVRKK